MNKNKFSRFLLLAAITIVASVGLGLKLSSKPTQVFAQDHNSCGAACTTDSNCGSNDFCHTTINWENWQEQTSVLNNVGTGPITGWNTFNVPNNDTIFHMTKGGKVYTKEFGNWNLGEDFRGCFGAAEGQCGTLTTSKGGFSNLSNPVVGYNTEITTENGIKVLTTHLVRYRGIFFMKTNYANGNSIGQWTEASFLDELLTTYGGNWSQWAYLSFDSNTAYEDGRRQQRLVIGRVDDRGTATIDDDKIYDTKMLARIQVRNLEGNLAWSSWQVAANTSNSLGSYELGGSSAQGSLLSYDSAYNADSLRYQDTIVRWYWNGNNYVPQVWQREAIKRANTQKLCRPLVYPQSCALPGYIPPRPTNTLAPEPSNTPIVNTGWSKPINIQGTVQCTNKKVALSWTMPAAEAARDYNIHTLSCKKTTESQVTCDNKPIQGYTISSSGVSYNSSTQKAQLVFDFNKLSRSDETLLQGDTYLFKFRVASKATPTQDSAFSDFISLKLTGPEGDINNSCEVSAADMRVAKDFFKYPNDVFDNSMLRQINKIVRNFGKSS